MRFGIRFPQQQIGNDPSAIRDFVQAAEGAGFDHLYIFDHVLGAHPDRFAGVSTGFPRAPYTHVDAFHEPLTLFAFLAGCTTRIELTTCVLVLPQRQTALVAKQAAEVALLSGGRLRLGVGVGWNHTEYESLGERFTNRGARIEEQITVLRRLWSEPLVTFEGRWHRFDRNGILPLPAAPIPVWMGGGTDERLLQRVARFADGWMPTIRPGTEPETVVARLHELLREQGRDPATFEIEIRIVGTEGGPAEWVADARRWQALGATHLGVTWQRPDVSAREALEQSIAIKRALQDGLG